MPKPTTITQEVIIETAFEMVRKEGFAVLSARNIAKLYSAHLLVL